MATFKKNNEWRGFVKAEKVGRGYIIKKGEVERTNSQRTKL